MKLNKILKLLKVIEDNECETFTLTFYTDKSVDLSREGKIIGSFHNNKQLYNYLLINFCSLFNIKK